MPSMHHGKVKAPRVRVNRSRALGPEPSRVALAFADRADAGRIVAGPYSAWVRLPHRGAGVVRVNMAGIKHGPAEFTVETPDFGVPPRAAFMRALRASAEALLAGRDVFVGCGYGYGRTGTFLAALFKLHFELLWLLRRTSTHPEERRPVEAMRIAYTKRAVETVEQEEFVWALNVRWLARSLAVREDWRVLFDKRFWML